MSYKLVPMNRSHLGGIAVLERLSFQNPWTETMLAEELFNDTAAYIVAEEEETSRVLGYAGLHVVLDEGYVDNIAVLPECRRQGIAGQMLEVMLRFGEAKLAFLTLEVRASNEGALALYRKYGFSEAGRRKNYYENPKEDALLLTRKFYP